MPVARGDPPLRPRCQTLDEARALIQEQLCQLQSALGAPMAFWMEGVPERARTLRTAQAMVDINDRLLIQLAILSPSSPLQEFAPPATDDASRENPR